MALGELCAMISGEMKKQVLFVVNLDSQNTVTPKIQIYIGGVKNYIMLS